MQCKVNILSFVVFYCNKDVWFRGCTVGLNQFMYCTCTCMCGSCCNGEWIMKAPLVPVDPCVIYPNSNIILNIHV